jgi:hypothetical protein
MINDPGQQLKMSARPEKSSHNPDRIRAYEIFFSLPAAPLPAPLLLKFLKAAVGVY